MNTVRTLTEAFPRVTASTPAQTSVTGAAGIVLNANAATSTNPTGGRKGFTIQNTGTTILYFTYGATNPTTTAYHIALAACTAANDGTGGIFDEDAWTGVVRAISSAAGGTCVITEFT